MTITSTVEFKTSLGRLSAQFTQMKLQWTTQMKLQSTISRFSQSLSFKASLRGKILGMIISSNFSTSKNWHS